MIAISFCFKYSTVTCRLTSQPQNFGYQIDVDF